jgi:bifunctional DNA-binding transcriptional regulator/antitoxin component of YhaV-PrlF toxin-antitoxin module
VSRLLVALYMMRAHDIGSHVKAIRTTLTDRGQVSVPAEIRRALKAEPGQTLTWQIVSDHECRVVVEPAAPLGAEAMRGFMKRVRPRGRWPKRTAGWMRLLREGERG